MDKDELILTAKNSVGLGISLGSHVKHALKTDEEHVYRVTGKDQIEDIILCGYVRPKGKDSKNIIYWSQGNKKLFYIDKRPVIEAPSYNVMPSQVGAIPISNLSAIYIFNEEDNKYENKLDSIMALYEENNKQNKHTL